MRNIFWLITLTLSSLVACYSPSNVIQANDKNFQQIVTTPGKFTFVDFYADWCRHCKKLSPVVDQLLNLFADYPQIQVVKINGDKDGKKMSKKYVTIGYPTLLMFDDSGQHVEFEGVRDVEAFSNFIQQLSGVRLDKSKQDEYEESNLHKQGNGQQQQQEEQDVIVSLTPQSFEQQLQNTQYAIVAIEGSWCSYCKEFAGVFDQIANTIYARNKNILFATFTVDEQGNGQEIIDKYGVKRLPALMLVKEGNLDNAIVYEGDLRRLDKVIDLINDFAGTLRDRTGELKEGAGVIRHISESIAKANVGEFEQVLSELDTLCGDTVGFYKSVVESLLTDANALNVEYNRIKLILDKDIDKLNGVTVDSLKQRLNVLNSLRL
ncbi:tigA [Candida theae]|uniref:TigA n=1 Tax=Candida theae TaxID=1198502 RepID=A0AAD5BBR5_9ASCO|nr:tigA [Candida theae]KAI5950067.1 tigA [Candida theae]